MCKHMPAVVILGPTASGKSALSLQAAEIYDAEIISLDSTLVYRGMDIGTAKPTTEEMNVCPHHLINIREPDEIYSAADFREDCIRLYEKISAAGRMCIICGGTMMYYKALTDGLSPLPETDPEVRKKLTQMGAELGWPALHRMLYEADAETASRLSQNDRQRISRALEVYMMTGRAMSSFYTEPKEGCPFCRTEFVLLPEGGDRSELREQIRKRFEAMLEAGLIGEVQKLREAGYDKDLPSMRSVGYRQVLSYLDGEYDFEEMKERAVIATARLAKHQMTWLRGGLRDSETGSAERTYLNMGDPDNLSLLIKKLDAAGFAEFRKK